MKSLVRSIEYGITEVVIEMIWFHNGRDFRIYSAVLIIMRPYELLICEYIRNTSMVRIVFDIEYEITKFFRCVCSFVFCSS
jgi:hypothetical protein